MQVLELESVVFQRLYQTKFFSSNQDVYQVGIISMSTYTEVPLYIHVIISIVLLLFIPNLLFYWQSENNTYSIDSVG